MSLSESRREDSPLFPEGNGVIVSTHKCEIQMPVRSSDWIIRVICTVCGGHLSPVPGCPGVYKCESPPCPRVITLTECEE